jgi:hypothetical protein
MINKAIQDKKILSNISLFMLFDFSRTSFGYLSFHYSKLAFINAQGPRLFGIWDEAFSPDVTIKGSQIDKKGI